MRSETRGWRFDYGPIRFVDSMTGSVILFTDPWHGGECNNITVMQSRSIVQRIVLLGTLLLGGTNAQQCVDIVKIKSYIVISHPSTRSSTVRIPTTTRTSTPTYQSPKSYPNMNSSSYTSYSDLYSTYSDIYSTYSDIYSTYSDIYSTYSGSYTSYYDVYSTFSDLYSKYSRFYSHSSSIPVEIYSSDTFETMTSTPMTVTSVTMTPRNRTSVTMTSLACAGSLSTTTQILPFPIPLIARRTKTPMAITKMSVATLTTTETAATTIAFTITATPTSTPPPPSLILEFQSFASQNLPVNPPCDSSPACKNRCPYPMPADGSTPDIFPAHRCCR